MEVILTHNNADFDAIASQLAVYKLNPQALPILPLRLNRNVAEFLALYRNGLPYVNWRDAKISKITHITLTDTQTRSSIRGASPTTPTLIIEHHPLERPLDPHETWQGETIGAVTTMLVERIIAQHVPITTLEATVMALGIYSDTGMLTYSNTTPRDVRAVAWLIEQGAVLDTVRRFLSSPLNDKQQDLFQTLLQHAHTRNIHGYPITICTSEVNEQIDGVNSVTHRLRDVLDSTAIFVLVAMPNHLQLVCRSSDDAVNVGKVSGIFGGGGHTRAAAASIEGVSLSEAYERIWEHLYTNVLPMVRVADLMSHGVQTVQAHELIRDISPRIHRIGHEGYPVLENGKVVGLLTRRDADRTLEHGLNKATVKEVMQAGEITLSPENSVSDLEQLIVDSGWGQIPVVYQGELLGIVTRTDLIKHWARVHPATPAPQALITPDHLLTTLGEATSRLIDLIAEHAQAQKANVYMVGGVVRDLWLKRPNLDVDFVVEGNAIAFARALCEQYGGKIDSFAPFGTAKWLLQASVSDTLGVALSDLPHHLDFATARNEFYAHPTALPTVYQGSIKLDLGRRDFTINTLAVQLSPANTYGRVLDYYGGISDLEAGIVRVLHSLSFVDDPTRILRAVRFSKRLGFSIEPRTAELIGHALPMLERITGERVRNEISLLLKEAHPELGIMALMELGILPATHRDFFPNADSALHARLIRHFQQIESSNHPQWSKDTHALYWHVLMGYLDPDSVQKVAERLLIGQNLLKTLSQTAELMQEELLNTPNIPASRLVQRLEPCAPIVLLAVWIMSDERPLRRERIEQFVHQWQHIHPYTNGHTLQALGIPPSPHYRRILATLREAWLDERVHTQQEEETLLHTLLKDVPRGTT